MADASGEGLALALAPAVVCRINELPDDVLLRALSHLDALQVVQTSMLSRRWRGLWRSVPRINASRDEFHGASDEEEECDVLFKAFFNRFLMVRNPVALDEFRLVYTVEVDSEDSHKDANLWIHHALQSNARSVQLSCLTGTYEVELQSTVLASKCFLTSLLLDYVFVEDGFFRTLRMDCTLLERLILRSCTIYAPEISSQKLKVLIIDRQCHCTYEGQTTISIPRLIDLHFSAPGRVPLLNNMESLVTASVSVGHDDTQGADVRCFLMALSGVTDLDLNYKKTTLEMDNDLDWCPKFNNLTKLTLGEWCLHANFYALIAFLQNSPNLVKLTLKFVQGYPGVGRFLGELEDRSFTCKHLQTVCLDGSKEDLVINNIKKLFLENGLTSDQIGTL